MKHSIKVLLLALTLIVSSCNTSKKAAEAEAAKKAADAKKAKPTPKKGDIQPYSKVVTKDAKTDEGLFKGHKIDDKYLYEIPESL